MFRTGDIIVIYGEMDDDGFFMGEIEGQRGLVPSNFLADIPHGKYIYEYPIDFLIIYLRIIKLE